MSDAPYIYGFDIATKMAIAHGRVGERPTFTRYQLTEEPGFRGSVLAAAKAVIETLTLFKGVGRPDFLAIEAPLAATPEGRGAAATIRLNDLAVAVCVCAQNLSIPWREAQVSTVRRAFLGPGCGNLPGDFAKREVMRFCRAAGWNPETHDESDAGAVWWWAGLQMAPRLAQPMDPISLRIPATERPRREARVTRAPLDFRGGEP